MTLSIFVAFLDLLYQISPSAPKRPWPLPPRNLKLTLHPQTTSDPLILLFNRFMTLRLSSINNWFKHGLKHKVFLQRPHNPYNGFRHTYATLGFESGLSIKEVQAQLGHGTFKRQWIFIQQSRINKKARLRVNFLIYQFLSMYSLTRIAK